MIIGVVGAPGVGKSSLITALSGRLVQCREWLEEPADHPFVTRLAEEAPEWHLLNQVGFQIRKIESMHGLARMPARHHLVEMDWVSNHHLWAAGLHEAGLATRGGLLALEELYRAACTVGTPRPDVFVLLTATLDEVLDRIGIRGRDFEHQEVMRRICRSLLGVDLGPTLEPLIRVPPELATGAAADYVVGRLSAVGLAP